MWLVIVIQFVQPESAGLAVAINYKPYGKVSTLFIGCYRRLVTVFKIQLYGSFVILIVRRRIVVLQYHLRVTNMITGVVERGVVGNIAHVWRKAIYFVLVGCITLCVQAIGCCGY